MNIEINFWRLGPMWRRVCAVWHLATSRRVTVENISCSRLRGLHDLC